MPRGLKKAEIAADLAAKRVELETRREKLEDHIEAIKSDLQSDIRKMNFQLELTGLSARAGIATGIDHLHRQLNHYNEGHAFRQLQDGSG